MENPAWLNDQSVPIIVMDSRGMILRVNSLFEKEFAWRGDDLAGRPVSTIIPPNLRDAHNMGFSRYLLSKRSTLLNQDLDLEILKGTGEILLARHHIVAATEGGEQIFAAKIEVRGGS